MNQPIKEAQFVIFDYETLNPFGGAIEPIELGAALLAPNFERQPHRDFSKFIKPPAHVPFTPFTTKLTGITPQHLEAADNASTVMQQFNSAYSDADYIFVAHNAHYDYGILRQYTGECAEVLTGAYLDTVKLAKHLLPELPSRSLDALTKYFGLVPPVNRHRALADAILTAEVLTLLIELGTKRGIFSTDQLMKAGGIKQATPKTKPQLSLLA